MFTAQIHSLIKKEKGSFWSGLKLKGIISREVEGLQMILMDRAWVPDVPLEVYFIIIIFLHIVFKFKFFSGLSFY